MGKGDKKSKRGKIIAGSYGKSRMKKESEPLFKDAGPQDKPVKAPKEEEKKEAKPKAKAEPKKTEDKPAAKKAEPKTEAKKAPVKAEKEDKPATE